MLKQLIMSAMTAVCLGVNQPGYAASDSAAAFTRMQELVNTSPKRAKDLEKAGKLEQANIAYRELATTVEQVETAPRKIYGPLAFGLYAQFLERRGDKPAAMQWYEKIANIQVNAHAYNLQAQNLQRYAALLLADGKKEKAAKLEAQARSLIKMQAELDASGEDY